jgi:Nucleotidyl transferase AbiEii toxin, Type IV TA system
VKREVTNVAASVRNRLLDRARTTQTEFGVILRRYFFERFLYRLGRSPAGTRFVLKGAMLLQLWSDHPYRATADLDLLRRGGADDESIRRDIEMILQQPVEPSDGVVFDRSSLVMEPIRTDEEYGGRRIHIVAALEQARERLQVDIGIGDAVWPPPRKLNYPTLLGTTAPSVLAYARETVIAEKLETMIVLGPRNSRIKDFFDIHFLASTFPFEGQILTEAICRTFGRRETPIPEMLPVGLTDEYWDAPVRETQIRAFARRARIHADRSNAKAMLPLLTAFLAPPLEHIRRGERFDRIWPPAGPWQSAARDA